MSDFDRLYRRFQELARSLDAQLKPRERLAAFIAGVPRGQEELEVEIALHEEALRIAEERRAALRARSAQAAGSQARAEREHCDALLAEIDREVPLLQNALTVLRERHASVVLGRRAR